MTTNEDKAQDVADDMLKRIAIKKRLKHFTPDHEDTWPKYEAIAPTIGWSELEGILEHAQQLRNKIPAYEPCVSCRYLVEDSPEFIGDYGMQLYKDVLALSESGYSIRSLLTHGGLIAYTLGIETLTVELAKPEQPENLYSTIEIFNTLDKDRAFIQQCYAANGHELNRDTAHLCERVGDTSAIEILSLTKDINLDNHYCGKRSLYEHCAHIYLEEGIEIVRSYIDVIKSTLKLDNERSATSGRIDQLTTQLLERQYPFRRRY